MTGRESKARRLLRGLAGKAAALLSLKPSDAAYATTYRAVTDLIEETRGLLGVSKARRKRTRRVHIDLPNPNDHYSPWVHVDTLPYDEALSFVQGRFNADDKGRIMLLTDAPDEDD